MPDDRGHLIKKLKRSLYGLTSVVTLIGLFAILSPLGSTAQTQQAGPSFPCEKATTASEKLICSDRELSALDLEYSRLYQERLREPDSAEVAEIRSNAQFSLQGRELCTNESLDPLLRRNYELECVASWYYWRIADLSEIPKSPPTEWSPRLIAGAIIYTDQHRGLQRTRPQKAAPDIYFRVPNVVKFMRSSGQTAPQPARIDRSVSYSVYRNVLGSLTYVREFRNDAHLDLGYFFNKDGRLAAHQRRFDTKSGNDVYVEYETVFYDASGRETRRVQRAFYGGRISTIRKDLSPPRLERFRYSSLTALSDAMFKDAGSLNVDQLGLCYINLSDGNGPQIRILNFGPEPLDFYARSVPDINYAGLAAAAAPPVRANLQRIGTLSGKRVYSVSYSTGLVGVLVERQAGLFLPVLFVTPESPIEHLEIATVNGQEVLFYSSTLSGTGHFTDEWYFILDRGVPRSVDYQKILFDELKRVLPEHFGVWKGGGFDLETLTFSHSVWKDGDSNCCPTGGSVQVVFGFERGRFFVKSSHWEKQN